MKINISLTSSKSKAPSKTHFNDAGFDCFSLEKIIIKKKSSLPTRVKLGFQIEIPKKHYGLLTSKSGLTMKGLVVVPGIIDSDYRGEVEAMVINLSNKDITFECGDKVAQLIIQPVLLTNFNIKDKININTKRGKGGFGSTGK